MFTILMMAVKMAAVDFVKIRVYLNKGYDVILFAHTLTNKILLHESNYIVDLVM